MSNTKAPARTSSLDEASTKRVSRAATPAKRKKFGDSTQERVLAFLSPVVFLVLWECVAQIGLIDRRFFPPPSSVFAQFWVLMFEDSSLLHDIYVTLRRVFIGFVVGGLPAMVLGLAMGFIRPLRLFIDPVVSMLYPIPKSAIMPLLLLIFGFGEASKWVLVAIGVFFPVLLNCMSGVMGINKVYTDVANNYGASRLQYLRMVAFPGALPLILSGLRLGLGMGLILVAVAEIVGAQDGLGYLIQHSWELFSVETMYVGLFLLGLIGIVTSLGLKELERKMVPWAAHK